MCLACRGLSETLWDRPIVTRSELCSVPNTLWIPETMTGQIPFNIPGGSGCRGTQLRGCPRSFWGQSPNSPSLRLARGVRHKVPQRNWCLTPITPALSAPPARSFKPGWCAISANHRRSLPRVMQWVAQRGLGVLPNQGGARRAGDIRGTIQCVALGLLSELNRHGNL